MLLMVFQKVVPQPIGLWFLQKREADPKMATREGQPLREAARVGGASKEHPLVHSKVQRVCMRYIQYIHSEVKV